MSIDQLTPAPWEVRPASGDGGMIVYRPTAHNLIRVCLQETSAYMCAEQVAANMAFIAIARSAFDVMMRRGVTPCQMLDGMWGILGEPGDAWPDPFTSLVEFDRWMSDKEKA